MKLMRRILCAVGLHRWEVEEYWSLGNCLVEGRVCADCKLTHPERKVLWRP